MSTLETTRKSIFERGEEVFINFKGQYIGGKIERPTPGYTDFMDIILKDKTRLHDVPVAWLQKTAPSDGEPVANTLDDLKNTQLEGRFRYVKVQQVVHATRASLLDALRYIGQPGGGKPDKTVLVVPYDKIMEDAAKVSDAIAAYNKDHRTENPPPIVEPDGAEE